MWDNTVELLSPTEMPTETGDHFVKNKDGAPLLAEFLHLLQKARRRRGHCLCLEQHTRDLIRIMVKQLTQGFQIVVAELQRHVRNCAGYTGIHLSRTDKPIVG